MGPSKQKKKAPADKPKTAPEENEFRLPPDLRDPWKNERDTESATNSKGTPEESEFRLPSDLRDPWKEEGGTKRAEVPKEEEGGRVRAQKAPKNKERSLAELAKEEKDYGERIKALRAKMENRTPKYHRGDPASRPRGDKPSVATYGDRKSRLGPEEKRRPYPKAGKKKKKS